MRLSARLLTIVFCLVLICSVSDAQMEFRHSRSRRHGPRASSQYNSQHSSQNIRTPSRVVFDGIAGTSVVESHEPDEPESPTYFSTQTIIPDSCERVSCMTHEDCTYNGCGGHFCVTCPACDGVAAVGVCLWNPSPSSLQCPTLNCPSLQSQFNMEVREPTTQNNTLLVPLPSSSVTLPTPSPSLDPSPSPSVVFSPSPSVVPSSSPLLSPSFEFFVPESPPEEEETQFTSPWESSFAALRQESQNRSDSTYDEQEEVRYNWTQSVEFLG